MHTFLHQASPQPLAAVHPSFPHLHSSNDSPSSPEPTLSGSSSSISESSSVVSTTTTGEETPQSSSESVSSAGHMNPPRKPQLRGQEQQHSTILPSQAAEYRSHANPQSHNYSQIPSSEMTAPQTPVTSLPEPTPYYQTPHMAPYPSVGIQQVTDHHAGYSQGQLASMAQAPSYKILPSFQDQMSSSELTPQPVPKHQAYPYQQHRAREEAMSAPPEQQYEEYMHNTGNLGLAAALYYDTQSQSGMPHQSAEAIGPPPARSSENPSETQQTTYSAHNSYEQHGLVPAQGYFPNDVHLLQLQGTPVPSLSTAMSTVPGFALVHPGSIAQPMLATTPQTHQGQLYFQPQGYDSVTLKSLNDGKKSIRGRTRSAMRFHECSVCGKRFGRPSALQTHVYSHTGEKPYKCDIDDCARCFSVLSNLRRHQRVHHGSGGTEGSAQALPQYPPPACDQGQDDKGF